jgi:hypothetical protein
MGVAVSVGVVIGARTGSTGSGYFWQPRKPETARNPKQKNMKNSFFMMDFPPELYPPYI